MCTDQNQDQGLHLEQKLNTELSELQEWAKTRLNKQLALHHQMVELYDRKLTKCNMYEEELEWNRTENARFKFTSQCLMDKIEQLTSSDGKKSLINFEKDVNDHDKNKDTDADPLTAYTEMCTKKLIDKVTEYKEQVEKISIELDNVNDQLANSAKTKEVLLRCLENLTVLAEAERMRRDREESELRKTVNQLTAELDKVQQEKERLRSVEAKISVEMMHHDSAQDEALRTDNAQLQAKLGTSGIVVATLQSRIFDLEKELAELTDVGHVQQEQSQISGFGGELIDGGSSTSMMLYQCNLSRTGDEHVASFLDLGRGDDQSIPCLLSIKSSGTTAEDVRLSCSQSTDDDRKPSYSESPNDDRQPSYSESTNDDHQPSYSKSPNDDRQPSYSESTNNDHQPSYSESTNDERQPSYSESPNDDHQPSYSESTNDDCQPTHSESTNNNSQPSHSESTDNDNHQLSYSLSSTVENCSTDTASSLAKLKNRRLADIIKKYESKHEEIK